MKGTEQYFPVVLFIMLYEVVLIFEFVDEIMWCDHLNETSLPVFEHGGMCFLVFCKMKFGSFCQILTMANFWQLKD